MAKKVIVLERLRGAGPGVRYVLWADVPAARQPFYAKVGAKSVYKEATAAEHGLIESGAIAERSGDARWPVGTTNAQVRASLVDAHAAWQAEVDGENDWNLYGSFWDGAAWTAAGVN